MKTWTTKSGYTITRILSGRSNVFLLSNGEINILVDTSDSRLRNRLLRRLNKSGIRHIEFLILTHAHFDHAGNAFRIKEKYNTRVIIQKNEAGYLAKGENILPGGTVFITRMIVKILGKRFRACFHYAPCPYDLVVDSHFDLADSGFNAYLMHTPGHSAGSMSVIVDDEVAIVGDAMFGIVKGSVFPPFAEDAEQMAGSWRKLLDTNCSVFLPSHGSENQRKSLENEYSKRKGKKIPES